MQLQTPFVCPASLEARPLQSTLGSVQRHHAACLQVGVLAQQEGARVASHFTLHTSTSTYGLLSWLPGGKVREKKEVARRRATTASLQASTQQCVRQRQASAGACSSCSGLTLFAQQHNLRECVILPTARDMACAKSLLHRPTFQGMRRFFSPEQFVISEFVSSCNAFMPYQKCDHWNEVWLYVDPCYVCFLSRVFCYLV